MNKEWIFSKRMSSYIRERKIDTSAIIDTMAENRSDLLYYRHKINILTEPYKWEMYNDKASVYVQFKQIMHRLSIELEH